MFAEPTVAADAWAEGLREYRPMLAGMTGLADMPEAYQRAVAGLLRGPRLLRKGAFLFHEGDPGGTVYFILRGRVAVTKQEANHKVSHVIGELGAGQLIGEVALLDEGPRSASVQAIEDVLLAEISDSGRNEIEIAALDRLKVKYGREISRRLRKSTDATVESLRARLEEMTKRAEMSRFISRTLVVICLYMFTLGVAVALSKLLPTTSIISLPIIGVFAFGVWHTVATSPYPPRAYGFTLEHWRRHVAEAVLYSLPVAGVIIAIKLAAMLLVPGMAQLAVFDLGRSTGFSLPILLAANLAYAGFTPIQEMIARSGMQCSFMLFLTGRHKVLQSILLSSLMFSATHLHVSLALALGVLPFGCFWGWMFHRQGGLVGCSVSHALLGTFAMTVVGFPGFF